MTGKWKSGILVALALIGSLAAFGVPADKLHSGFRAQGKSGFIAQANSGFRAQGKSGFRAGGRQGLDGDGLEIGKRGVGADSLIVSLLTCDPGPDIYELCGHEAIRVRNTANLNSDSVWNYGTFDFDQPNFVYRFVKGETDYMVSSYPTWIFLREYTMQGRHVREQELNLSQAEARKLLAMLRHNALPENRTYRYNYVKDNCATRITAMLDKASDRHIVYPDSVNYGTFRNEMRHFHRDYPWYQYGIDLALGSGLDYPISGRDEMFVPMVMAHNSAGAHFDDGTPLVRADRTLVQGVPDATLGPTHPAATPLAVSWTFFALCLALCLTLLFKKRIGSSLRLLSTLLYSIWFGLLGAAGCIIAFLVFVSSHEATTPNLLLIWLNPLQFVVSVGVWFRRKMRAPTLAMIYVNIILMCILLIVWPMQMQSANPAFFPQMGATLMLAVTYAINHTKSSFNSDEEVSNLGAGRNCGSRSRGTNRNRPSKTGGRNRR